MRLGRYEPDHLSEPARLDLAVQLGEMGFAVRAARAAHDDQMHVVVARGEGSEDPDSDVSTLQGLDAPYERNERAITGSPTACRACGRCPGAKNA